MKRSPESNGGRGGIRTHGASPHAGFQDRCNRPLCHPSQKSPLSSQNRAVRLVFIREACTPLKEFMIGRVFDRFSLILFSKGGIVHSLWVL